MCAEQTLLHNLAAVLVDEAEIAVVVAEIHSGRHLWSFFVTIHVGPILLPIGPKSPSNVCRPKGTAYWEVGLLISSS